MAEQEPASAHHVKTVLVVEDDLDIGEVVVQALAQETAYLPLLATNGEEALTVVKEIRPDLVVLDYQLPDMTGIELYDHLHAQKALAAVPAIVMSANVPHHELNKRHLVDLEKPFDLDTLVDLLEMFLG